MNTFATDILLGAVALTVRAVLVFLIAQSLGLDEHFDDAEDEPRRKLRKLHHRIRHGRPRPTPKPVNNPEFDEFVRDMLENDRIG